jgi:uncharacterized protein (DUF2267 family)
MQESSLVSRVRERAGFAGHAEALRAIRAVVMAVGERLHDDEREALGRTLPESLAPALGRVAYAGDFDRDAFFSRVARHEAVAMCFGVEHAEVVCQALGALLPEEELIRLRRQLGASIGALFDAPEEIPTIARTTSTAGSTLSSGRPGSRHPISESRADRAQSNSVVRTENPHGDTKVSSARN